jgi:hypothetical protein
LPGRKSGELGRVAQTTCGGIRHESGPVRITHAHLAADSGTTDVDSVTRAGVARLLLLEKVQDVFGAQGGPLRRQPVVLVCQCAAAAHGDQSGITFGGQNRHEFILSCHPARSPRRRQSRRTAGNGSIDHPLPTAAQFAVIWSHCRDLALEHPAIAF